MKKLITGIGLFFAAATAQAKAPKPSIAMDQAKEIALARVEGGTIKSAELEQEHGLLIYSFDIRDRHRRIVEVNVDAHTGAVVAVEHESEEKEREEGD